MKTHRLRRNMLGMLLTLLMAGSFAQATPADAHSPLTAQIQEREVRSPLHPFALVEPQQQAQGPGFPPGQPPAPPPSEFEGRPPGPPVPSRHNPLAIPDVDDRRGHRQGTNERADDMAMLDRLLAMPPEQLARMRQALEQIESMTPEERKNLRERLKAYQEISPEKRREMRKEWKEMSQEERREHIREMRERRWEALLEEKAESTKTPPE